jgi:hypothetical protein
MEIAGALERIKVTVGPRGWVADPAEQEPYLTEARRLWRGATRLVVRPASTREVAEVVQICAKSRLPIVPQGGNTGLVGGGGPSEDGDNIVLALGRMNRIRAIDPVNFTMTVERAASSRSCKRPPPKSTGYSRSASARRAVARSAAICPPTPAALRYCAMAILAS